MPPDDIVVDPAPAATSTDATTQPAQAGFSSPAVPDPAPAADPAPNDPPANEPQDWPDDWRQKAAGGDDKLVKRLERYNSPRAVAEALIAAQDKIRAGGAKQTLKADATPEEIAQWRTDNGIPESPDKYEIALPDGYVIGEADKPVVDGFLERMHAKNTPPEVVNEALGWYYQEQAKQLEAQVEADLEFRERGQEELRDEYGADYKRNVRIALEVIPQDLRDVFMGGRMADGSMIGDNPGVIRWLSGMAREINPLATVVPGSGSNAMQAMETEMANLKNMMGDRQSAYWKGPSATKNQARYRELVAAQQRTK